MPRKFSTSRRTFLKTAAATGGVLGLGGVVATQEDVITESEIGFNGRRSGWVGLAPESIADQRNPTLRLIEGQDYTLTWTNADGDTHNFIIESEDGERFVDTELVSTYGDSQTVEFTAQPAMTTYYCGPHPNSMRGQMEVVQNGDGQDGEEPAEEINVDTVVDIPGDPTPENIAVDADGALYFSITAGEIRRLSREQTQETDLALEDTELVSELPGGTYGVEVLPDGTLYAAVHSGEDTGIWLIPRSGGEAEPFAIVGVQDEVFPNGIQYDRLRDRLLFTESFGGVVYEAPLDAGDPANAATVWFEDDRLNTETFGANGLTFGPDGGVFVAVTEDEIDGEQAGRIVRVPIVEDGAAGEGETYLEGPELHGMDGIVMHLLDRTLYATANFQNSILSVTQDQAVETVIPPEAGLVFPSDVAFGTIPSQCNDLFICNFAPEQPEASAILRWSA